MGPGWVDGWMRGWVDGRAGLRIAYSNKKLTFNSPHHGSIETATTINSESSSSYERSTRRKEKTNS